MITPVSFAFAKEPPQEGAGRATDSALMPSPTPKVAIVEYVMAYPGILPDNPLYFLKTARDRLVSILISDAEKRADFYVLNSDKRLGAAVSLIDKNKDSLAIITLSKSNNYMHQAISQIEKIKLEKKDTEGLREKIRTSIDKHLELLETAKTKMDKKYLQDFNFERMRLEEMKRLVLPKGEDKK